MLPCTDDKRYKSKKFLTPDDADYKACVKSSYCGFEIKSASQCLKPEIHKNFQKALMTMQRAGLFHYDLVQFGTTVNSTRVQRVLVGEPGMTYLYQKLRLFALPWNDESVASGSLLAVKQLNDMIRLESEKLLKQKRDVGGYVGESAGVGSCDFNLTLINAARNNRELDVDGAIPVQKFVPFREESRFGMGKCAVNWHRDSTLEPFSTIAVYHHTPLDRNALDWKIAMAVDEGSNQLTSPALAVPLRDGDCYFMLGNFNHHHIHSVIAGTSTRYASTHRVAVTAQSTWREISEYSKSLLNHLQSEPDLAKSIRKIGEGASCLEFGWIRQFYVQGGVHAKQHETYWAPRIQRLEKIWKRLNSYLQKSIQSLILGTTCNNKRAYNMAIYILESRIESRREWQKRYHDKQYQGLEKPFRPIIVPEVDVTTDVDFVGELRDKMANLF
uniref:Alpha-ketoglutarate-dependent dioxygenase FTO n=1 Tax=Aplanochytrium stocchinoi TaxID=215587 RepID=A0A7S3LM41_9STRA